MTGENKVSVSPQAISEFEMIVRETMETRLNALERRLLIAIEMRLRAEKKCAELRQDIERLQHINANPGGVSSEGEPNAD